MIRLIKGLPRWTVLQIDILICAASFFLAVALRYSFNIPGDMLRLLHISLPIALVSKTICFLILKSHTGIIRFTSIEDAKKILKALSINFIFLMFLDLGYRYYNHIALFPFSIQLMDFFMSFLFMIAFRMIVKIMYYESRGISTKKVNVLIYGAGDSGIITKKTLIQDAGMNYNVVGFLDDDPKRSKMQIDGLDIFYAKENFKKIIKENQAELLVIAIPNISPARKQEIIDVCINLGVEVRSVPPAQRWINGELSFKQIKEVRIEDLLGREPIQIENSLFKNEIFNKTILITGAAGSVGSELARIIARCAPKKLLLADQAESPLYDLDLELSELPYKINFECLVADITNQERMEGIFSSHLPDMVFHAAAYKHVPVMEENPSEAVMANVTGTKVIADLAVRYNTEKFVMISTDKAVNPTNVMGATKRIAEMYTQSLNDPARIATRFITVRFGNVLGSNGSVIPRFKKQISEGGPVTITHPEVTRYFMTITEASRLVLEAAAMGKGGEIFLFDMGKSIRIVDLAKKMIRLSGLTLGRDIQIVFTGLRPGEKLNEELLNEKENTIPTHHPKIMIAKVRPCEPEEISMQVNELTRLFAPQENEAIILKMKQIVPEFVSNNSVYERLDSRIKG